LKKVLVVEDDADIALSLKYNLERQGKFTVVTARDGEEGLRKALDKPPDIVLLDLNLPGLDGLEVCRRLKGAPATVGVPIIMITARVGEVERIAGLDLGADDYVTKPFSVKEVVARVRAVLRRSGRTAEEGETLGDGPISMDVSARIVTVHGREVALTRKEFDLLADLMRSRGRVLTRERLLERVWGYDFPGETRTVDVHIRRLRMKLGEEAASRIETIVGVGYRYRGAA
jgi:two-component system, OmpR family, alkaline phosphatase synthesis response regulator PhoP